MPSRSAVLSNRLSLLVIGQANRSHFCVCKLREHDQVPDTYQPHFWPSNTKVNPHYELYRVQRAQVNEVYLNGSGNHYRSPHQSEAMENVYYWYDGNVPYCTDVTAWQPIDDNYVHMNVPAYSYIDNSHGAITHQLVNIRHGHTSYQEGLYHLDLYTPQHWEPSYPHAHNGTYDHFSAPASPYISIASHCASTLSSLSSWNDLPPSPPAQHRRQEHTHTHTHSHTYSHTHSDDASLGYPGLQLATPHDSDSSHDSTPSVSQVASPVVYSQLPRPQPHQEREQSPAVEAQTPGTPPSVPHSPASELGTQDLVGPRAPKRRRVTRSVQPLACFFCRGRKIACGPPTSTRSGDRTCEPCARRHLVCEYPAESYRGRRAAGAKGTSVRPQQR